MILYRFYIVIGSFLESFFYFFAAFVLLIKGTGAQYGRIFRRTVIAVYIF